MATAIKGATWVDLHTLLQCQCRRYHPSSPCPPTQRGGQYLSSQKGRGMEFAEVRDYRPGDDIRHIDWRTTAKTGKTHVKRYHQDKEQPCFLLIDLSPSMYFGTRVAFKSVIAAKLAAYFASATIRQGDQVGGMILHGNTLHNLPPRPGRQGLLPLLGSLSQASLPIPSHASDLAAAGLRLRHMIRSGSKIVVISDFSQLQQGSDAVWHHLRKRCQLKAIIVSDPLERQAPPAGYYPITNGQRQAMLDTHRGDVNQRFEHRFQQIVDQTCDIFGHAQTLMVSTGDDLAQFADKYVVGWQTRNQHGSH